MPPARPDLPILVAAKRPRMLALTARHADAWNMAWYGPPEDRLARVRADLAEACLAAGRDPATLVDTVGVNVRFDDLMPRLADGSVAPPSNGPVLSGTPAEVAVGLVAHAAAGADHIIVALDPTTPEAVARLAEAIAIARDGIAQDQIARSSRSE